MLRARVGRKRVRISPIKPRVFVPLPQLGEGERRITSFFAPLTPLTANDAVKQREAAAIRDEAEAKQRKEKAAANALAAVSAEMQQKIGATELLHTTSQGPL